MTLSRCPTLSQASTGVGHQQYSNSPSISLSTIRPNLPMPIQNSKHDSLDQLTELPTSPSWEVMFERVQKYFSLYGRGSIPPPTTNLGAWSATQRLDRRQGMLSADREVRLSVAGFEWSPHWSGVTWGQRYAELVEFYNKHGHCRVRYSGGGLGGWVSTQRRAKKGGRLSEERIRKLEEIGFIWDARPDSDGRALQVKPASSADMNPSLFSKEQKTLVDAKHEKYAPVYWTCPSAPEFLVKNETENADCVLKSAGVSALAHAVNLAVEEREMELANRKTRAPNNLASESSEAIASMPFNRNKPPRQTTLPAKKRVRTGDLKGPHCKKRNELGKDNNSPCCTESRLESISCPTQVLAPATTSTADNCKVDISSLESHVQREPSGVLSDSGNNSSHGIQTYSDRNEGRGRRKISNPSVEKNPDDIEHFVRCCSNVSEEPLHRDNSEGGVRRRMRAFVTELVAEVLADPPRNQSFCISNATSPVSPSQEAAESHVRRWARTTYVSMSAKSLSQVVSESKMHCS